MAAGGDVLFFFKWGRLKKKTSCFSNQVRRGCIGGRVWGAGVKVKVDRQGSTLVKVKERDRRNRLLYRGQPRKVVWKGKKKKEI